MEGTTLQTATSGIDRSDKNVLFAKTQEAIAFVLDHKNGGKCLISLHIQITLLMES
jgi:hypothetical protein